MSKSTRPVIKIMWLVSNVFTVCYNTKMLVRFGDDPQIASLQTILWSKKIKNVLLDDVLTDGLRMNCIYESSVAGWQSHRVARNR
jgi:hypothetical protein